MLLCAVQRDSVLSEPAVEVRRRSKGKQIWAMEKMENRLVDMRELYQEWKDFDEDDPVRQTRTTTTTKQQSVAALITHRFRFSTNSILYDL